MKCKGTLSITEKGEIVRVKERSRMSWTCIRETAFT